MSAAWSSGMILLSGNRGVASSTTRDAERRYERYKREIRRGQGFDSLRGPPCLYFLFLPCGGEARGRAEAGKL